MKIELKNIHYSEQLSEETAAFSASLYINGYKAGTVSNQGHGGATNYTPFNEKGRQLIKEAKAYCKSLPPEKYTVGGEEHQLDMNLELYMDNLLTDYLKEKDLQQFRKEIKKTSNTQIVIGIPDQYFRTLNIKMAISVILNDPTRKSLLIAILKDNILPRMQEDERVLNTNIPVEVLKQAGLKENQYVQQGTEIRKEARQKNAHHKGKSL
ncbi:MAG: hypothetical protein EPN39_13195 [Chitinophagaceae bacterium]|nr:MAG: hypothetical protein EPN39_13195 [Chitinophagaceae bacterium]